MEISGPFKTAAIELSHRKLAVIPVGGEDRKRPLVSFGKWTRRPGPEFIDKLIGKHPRANVGIITGLSGVTVVDVDDPEHVATMLQRCGDTPLVTNTPSGGSHLWYMGDGERCANLRSEGLAVDVKAGNGFVVVPPSTKNNGSRYEFSRGSWDDLVRLPKVKQNSLPKRNLTRLRAVKEGQRNDFLFRELLRQVRGCDDLDALIDVAESINDHFLPPLSEAEVVETAQSVWKYETEGNNWVGKETRIVFTASQYGMLMENPDALTLQGYLLMKHAARQGPFAVSSKAMAAVDVIPGWGPKRFTNARRWLEDKGFLILCHQGGQRPKDPSLFQLSCPPIKEGEGV